MNLLLGRSVPEVLPAHIQLDTVPSQTVVRRIPGEVANASWTTDLCGCHDDTGRGAREGGDGSRGVDTQESTDSRQYWQGADGQTAL